MNTYNNNELYHFGIVGQKWGVRRYQNSDGTLTEEGIRRYRASSYDQMSDKNKRKYNRDIKKFNSDTVRANDRLKRRERYIEKKTDETRNAAKLGTMSNIRKSGDLNELNKRVRDTTKFLNENPDQKQKFGRITKRQRIGTIAGGSAVAAGAAFAAYAATESALVSAFPPAAVAAGAAYVYNLTRR